MSNPNNTGSCTVTIPAEKEISVTVARRDVGSLTVKFSEMNADTLSFIFDYGIRQLLNDAKAGTKNAADAMDKAKGRLAKLMAGTVGKRVSSAVPGSADPIEAIALELAADAIKAAFKQRGFKVADHKDQFAALVKELAGKPHIVQQAETVYAARKATMDNGLDLSGIFAAMGGPAPAQSVSSDNADATGGDDGNEVDTNPLDDDDADNSTTGADATAPAPEAAPNADAAPDNATQPRRGRNRR